MFMDHAQHDDSRPDNAGVKNPHHSYRLALEEALGGSVEVATLEQAMTSPQMVRRSAPPLVIVTTIQSYRISDDEGRELSDTRRIYRDNGYMQEALADLPAWARGPRCRFAGQC